MNDPNKMKMWHVQHYLLEKNWLFTLKQLNYFQAIKMQYTGKLLLYLVTNPSTNFDYL